MMPWENANIIGMSINPRITRSSTMWAREPAIQSSALEEWGMAWKRHKNGTSCKARWMAYSARRANTTARQHCTRSARTCDPVERLGRMVDGMEAPQERHLVQGSMDGVFGEVRQHDGQEELHQPGQATRRCLQIRVAQNARELSGGKQDEGRRGIGRGWG